MTATAAPGAAPAQTEPGRNVLRDLARAAFGPVICAVVLTGLLSAWVATGGAGTLSRVRLQISLAAVPMRAFTPRAAASAGAATTFLTIRNLSDSPDQLVAVRSPIARHVVLTVRDRPAGPRKVVSDLAIPAHGTLTLSPFGEDVVLRDPAPFETASSVPLILTFRHAGTVTLEATVTAPGTPLPASHRANHAHNPRRDHGSNPRRDHGSNPRRDHGSLMAANFRRDLVARRREVGARPASLALGLYRFRTRIRYCDLLFGRMG